MDVCCMLFFFKQKTAYEMRNSDWSSDVCSSDLNIHTEPISRILEQVGALPFRRSADGVLEVMLITSRDTGRWIIPKGWPMEGRSGPSAAQQEAFEEAGVLGIITGMPNGT